MRVAFDPESAQQPNLLARVLADAVRRLAAHADHGRCRWRVCGARRHAWKPSQHLRSVVLAPWSGPRLLRSIVACGDDQETVMAMTTMTSATRKNGGATASGKAAAAKRTTPGA